MVIGSFCRLALKVAHDKVVACPVVIIASRKSRADECEFLSQRVRRLLARLGRRSFFLRGPQVGVDLPRPAAARQL
jgi:hypothetical protein